MKTLKQERNKNVMRSTLHVTRGFTLVESLVAITIFSILSVVVSGIFINVNRLQNNTASFQRLQNEGRYILEKLAREIRGREIDYSAFNDTTHLYFKKDEYGESVAIYQDWRGESNISSLGYSTDSDLSGRREDYLNAPDVEIIDVKFILLPEDDPATNFDVNNQPRVAILLKLRNLDVAPQYQRELTVQTTISSKVYKR